MSETGIEADPPYTVPCPRRPRWLGRSPHRGRLTPVDVLARCADRLRRWLRPCPA